MERASSSAPYATNESGNSHRRRARAGKSSLISILERIMGPQLVTSFRSVHELFCRSGVGKLEGVRLVYIEDAGLEDCSRCSARTSDQLKALVTESEFSVDQLYRPTRKVELFANFIFCTNDLRVAERLRQVRRRYFVLQADAQHFGAEPEARERYFERLRAVDVRLVAKYFCEEVDIADFNPAQMP
jgi:hypothetical protein